MCYGRLNGQFLPSGRPGASFMLTFLVAIALASVTAAQELLRSLEAEVCSLVEIARTDVVTVNVLRSADSGSVRSVLVASGVSIAESLVVTAASVVHAADSVEISGPGYEPARAEILGVDPVGGIALLKTDPVLGPVSFSSTSTTPRVGDWACLVAMPFEEMAGYSFGVVSAVRPAGMNGQVTTEIEASMKPVAGSAGAVLVNTRGQFIGLVVGRTSANSPASYGSSAGDILAVPLAEVLAIADQLRVHGRVVRNWLGISVQDMTPALRNILSVESGMGAIVIHVEENGPAFEAGIEMGDVVLACGDTPVHGPAGLMQAVAERSPGDTFSFEILRNGQTHELPVQLGELPQRPPPSRTYSSSPVPFAHDRISTLEQEILDLKAELARNPEK
jgi:S1-C subfamily serine protease